MLICPECRIALPAPFRKTWWEKIDGENWCEFSEITCPYCGSPDVFEPNEYDLEDEKWATALQSMK